MSEAEEEIDRAYTYLDDDQDDEILDCAACGNVFYDYPDSNGFCEGCRACIGPC